MDHQYIPFEAPLCPTEDSSHEEQLLSQRLYLESFKEQITDRTKLSDKAEPSQDELALVTQDALVCVNELTEDVRKLLHIRDPALGQLTDPAFDAVQEIVRRLSNISRLKVQMDGSESQPGNYKQNGG